MTIDAGHVRALAARLVTPELIVFPVRHHSPACAWQLRRLFDELSPSMVLVEGPRSFTPHIPLLAHAEAIAPFAMYTYIVQGLELARGRLPNDVDLMVSRDDLDRAEAALLAAEAVSVAMFGIHHFSPGEYLSMAQTGPAKLTFFEFSNDPKLR